MSLKNRVLQNKLDTLSIWCKSKSPKEKKPDGKKDEVKEITFLSSKKWLISLENWISCINLSAMPKENKCLFSN